MCGITLALILSLLTSGSFKPNGVIYADTGIVTEVDYSTDEVTVELVNGNLFSFKGTEDWITGDFASLLMYDNNTRQTVKDDRILHVKYSGHLEQFKKIPVKEMPE